MPTGKVPCEVKRLISACLFSSQSMMKGVCETAQRMAVNLNCADVPCELLMVGQSVQSISALALHPSRSISLT